VPILNWKFGHFDVLIFASIDHLPFADREDGGAMVVVVDNGQIEAAGERGSGSH
jgi:hypothetical protein